MEARTHSLLNELNFDKGGFFDLGHPLLNRIAESFIKAAGIGAVQAVSREAYFTAVEDDERVAGVNLTGTGLDSGNGVPEIPGAKKHRFPELRGATNRNSLEAMVKSTGKESLQWGKHVTIARFCVSAILTGCRGVLGFNIWVEGDPWSS
ncbi:outer envelope pore protein 16-2, chloroplastic-like isoform X4 [Syzygium oleosum]|uniref:outer envelope pore protein 16-2, chloroplastic-like isoform X4 n=1 Tax=Syzygium oleosum TaxID=219896 RepID=UPI0024BA5A66|nr:outer envelope pore protein 16-2, chloroplastic-like isoform X4 [Syzygium oleosum]